MSNNHGFGIAAESGGIIAYHLCKCGDGTILEGLSDLLRHVADKAWAEGWTHGVGFSTGQTKGVFDNPYRTSA